MKNFNIIGVHQFVGEGGFNKAIYMSYCLIRETWAIYRGLGKKEGGGYFWIEVDTPMHTTT